MASANVVKYSLSSNTWTKVANGVSSSITFQNLGQNPIYVQFSNTGLTPSSNVGIVYNSWQGELKKSITDLTYITSPNTVFARSITSLSAVVVEFS